MFTRYLKNERNHNLQAALKSTFFFKYMSLPSIRDTSLGYIVYFMTVV